MTAEQPGAITAPGFPSTTPGPTHTETGKYLLAHLPGDSPDRAVCGTPLQLPAVLARPGHERCVVCLDLGNGDWQG